MKTYFIFYNYFLKDGRSGIANANIEVVDGITCIDDIRAIEHEILISNESYEQIVINNYIEFHE